MNIIFTGMRGSGKTTLGKQLAELIGWDFIDVDAYLEEKLNNKIDQYVHKNGWKSFREKEKEAAKDLAKKDKTIIATGGGTMIDPENAAVLKQNGFVVFLYCEINTLKKYLKESYERPSLTGKKSSIDEIDEIWEKRKERYHTVTDLVFETTHWPDAKELLSELKKHPQLQL